MADIQSTVILKADSTEAVQSIKDLEENVRIYKEKLLQLNEGTYQYNQTLQQLAQSQDRINQINTEANAAALGMAGKIEQLRNNVEIYKNELLNLEEGTDQYSQTLQNLAQAQEQINQINQEANIATQEQAGGIQQLKNDAATYSAELLTLEEGTDQYNQTLHNLAQTQEHINQINTEAGEATLEMANKIEQLEDDIATYQNLLLKLRAGTDYYNQTLRDLIQAQEQIDQINKEANVVTKEQTVGMQELKDQVATYKDELLNLQTGTEEYNQTLQNLAEAQNRINQLEKEAKTATANLAGGIVQLQNDIENYKDKLLSLDKASQEYEDTVKKLIKAQEKLNSVNDATKAASAGVAGTLSHLTDIGEGVEKGFGALGQAANLLGIDTGGLAETLNHVKAGLNMMKQLQTMAKGVKSANLAFKAFTATLLANPIMAIVAGVALLIAGLTMLVSWLRKNSDQTKQLNKAQEEHNKTMEKLNKTNEQDLEMAKAKGATAEQLIILEREQIEQKKKKIQVLINQYQAYSKLNAEQKQQLQNLKDELKLLDEREDKLKFQVEINKAKDQAEKDKKAEKDEEDRKNQRLANQKAYAEKEKESAQQHAKTLEEIEKEKNKRITDAYSGEKRLEFLNEEIKKNEELQQKLLEDSNNKKLTWAEREKAAKDYQQALRDSHALTVEFAEVEKQVEEDNIRKAQEEAEIKRELAAIQERLNPTEPTEQPQGPTAEERIQQLREEAEAKLKLVETEGIAHEEKMEAIRAYNEAMEEAAQLEEQEAEIKRALAAATKELTEAENPEELTGEQRLQQLKDEAKASLELAQDVNLSYEQRMAALEAYNKAIADSAELEMKLEKAKEEEREESFAKYTDLLSKGTDMVGENTVAGKVMAVAGATINTYLAGTKALASVPFPYSLAALASTISTGVATVKNILSTKVEGATDTASASTASAATPSLPSFPEMSTDFVETHNNLDAYDEEVFNQQPVLVVEDVNSVQNRVKVAENEATF